MVRAGFAPSKVKVNDLVIHKDGDVVIAPVETTNTLPESEMRDVI